MNNYKYTLECDECKHAFDMSVNIIKGQKCPSCDSKYLHVKYKDNLKNLAKTVFQESDKFGLWKFSEYLPIGELSDNVRHENNISIQNLNYLEDIAKNKFGIDCTVYGHRFDESISTGTWKDLTGSMLGSALKEHGIKNYVAASTGNIGVAMACYLTLNDINLYVFIPESSSKAQEIEIASFGQNVIRVKGDYNKAKTLAKAFASKNNYVYSNGTFDIFRLEAKKTMAYEWLRNLDIFPTVYIQALSGGTGPLGVFKGCSELIEKNLIEKHPRQILVQTDRCAPMADAWAKSKANGFPENWFNNYDVIDTPETTIATLSTGNPYAYPQISKMIKSIDGEIIQLNEKNSVDIAKSMAVSTSVRIGPAASIGVGGFYKSLKNGLIKNGDVIMINVGEGARRSPKFMSSVAASDIFIDNIDEIDYNKLNSTYNKDINEITDKIIKEI